MEILATSALGAKRKLNMVCLHGKNTSKAIFEFQSRTFREKFGDVIDFHILEGPHNEVEPPLQVFLDRGFQAPFKSYYYTKEHLGEEPLCPFDKSANHSVGGLEESIKSYVDFSKEHGPFDGALTFSQGGLFARHMHRIVNTIDREYWEPHFAHERVKLPKFLITFGGPFFPKQEIDYKEKRYKQFDYKFDLESCHFYGKKDDYLPLMTAHTLFTKEPVIIYHEQGHQFPRSINDEDFLKVKEFVRRQHVSKYGCDEDFVINASSY
ncbi:hypothetical protein FGO68_gene15629 [Halteria grandinella]|uniref:Serine hydrolase domain-containing protein n=1 Tax=Halteria grandinella TaxID=5974 RepID=A0A8J8NJC3_HALGN|nr:hypothetical protein FGO68_gene15629 [Halteria grandinella]